MKIKREIEFPVAGERVKIAEKIANVFKDMKFPSSNRPLEGVVRVITSPHTPGSVWVSVTKGIFSIEIEVTYDGKINLDAEWDDMTFWDDDDDEDAKEMTREEALELQEELKMEREVQERLCAHGLTLKEAVKFIKENYYLMLF